MEYNEKLVFPEHGKTAEKGTTITDVAYQLRAVIVHEGDKISTGHYICYFKRGEKWYYSSDTHVHTSSALEATSQPAYLLFYEKCIEQELQEVRYLSKESQAKEKCNSQMPKREDDAVCVERAPPAKLCIPPGYYSETVMPFKAGASPGIYKTAMSSKAWKYSPLDKAAIDEAEVIAMAGVQVPKHPRVKGWEPSDVERLLPVELKVTDSKLSNFIINQVFLMIEQHSQAANKNIQTVNSDVYSNMTKLSMDVFSRFNYGELYGNILTADIILCPVLHGDHWCLVVIHLPEKRMVYLDSMFNGIGAQTAFSRFMNFLECMAMYHQLSPDWNGWEFYCIPSSEIAQQTTSVDCGVFVIKWAQHIAEGRPLDFTQKQMHDLRFSLILDIARDTLSVLSSEPEQLKDEGLFSSNASASKLKTGKTNNPSSKIKKEQLQQPQPDSDSDFESPKKRTKKQVPKKESSTTATTSVNNASNAVSQDIQEDHCYAKEIDTDPTEVATNSKIPQPAKQVLPSGYSYKCLEYQELPSECFTGAPQTSFYVKLSVGNITSKEEVDQWLHQFAASSNIKYNANGGYKRKGVKVVYARWYICQCKRKNLTKKQAAEKEAAKKRKEKRHGTHKENSVNGGSELHLLSKTRDKKTDCDSKMAIRVHTNRKLSELCEIELWWNHNHSVDCFHLTSFCSILPATKDKFSSYFEQGMSATEAFHHHENQLMRDPVTLMLLADRKICPSLRDVNNMYEKWLIENKGPSNGPEMFDRLETLVQEYNTKHTDVGGKCFLERYKDDGGNKQQLVLSICTPLMSRVHETRQASEMAFLDSSGSLDRHNNPVFFMCTHHPCGALPLAVWVTSSQSQTSLESCLESVKSIVPKHAFGNRGPETGPDIFMTDDDTAQRQALRAHWKQATLLLCIFHFLQATWRWLIDSKHSISKDDRQHLMTIMQDLVFATQCQEFQEIVQLLPSDPVLKKYPVYQEYLKKAIDRKKEWALSYRADLRTRGNNTDNYTESMIFVFKCVVLRRMRAYNLIELFRFITEDLEMYFQRKLLSLAFGKPQNLHLAARCFGRNASSVNLNTITKEEGSPYKFNVPSREDNNVVYVVDCSLGICTCLQGVNGNACPHQAAVALKFGINNVNFIPQTANDRFNLATLAVGSNRNFSVTQFVSLHQKEIESNPDFSGDCEMEQDTLPPLTVIDTSAGNSTSTHQSDDVEVPEEISLEEILQLHQETSQDIEYRLRTSDNNFRKCYYKYLSLYRKIVSKCRGQAPISSLASAYVQFGKNKNGTCLPILHNGSQIRVQPTAISRRKSGIKSSTAQPSGRRRKLTNGVKTGKENMTVRKTLSNQKRKRNLAFNVRSNLPNAGPTR